MPLTKRTVSPLNLCRNRLPQDITENELECVANGTLANIIRQLSSLSRHAESIFGEIFHEAVKVEHKANTICTRLDRLVVKVSQLDNTSDEVSLKDLPLLKPFKSSMLIDQQSLSRYTMPSEMAEKYRNCDQPPELDKLNPYRSDSRRALKFYTDPDYFFELWRCEMLKVSETPKRPKSAQKVKATEEKRRKQPRQPHDHRQKYYEKAIKAGEPIMQQYVYDDRLRYGSKTYENFAPQGVDGSGMKYSELVRSQGAVSPNAYAANSVAVSSGRSVLDENLAGAKRGTATPLTVSDQTVLRRNFPPFSSSSDYPVHSNKSNDSAADSFPNHVDSAPASSSPCNSPEKASNIVSHIRPTRPPPLPPSAMNSRDLQRPVNDTRSYAETAFTDRHFKPQPSNYYSTADASTYENELNARVTKWSLETEAYRVPPVDNRRVEQTPTPVNAYEGQREKSLSPELPPPPPPLLSNTDYTEMTNLMSGRISVSPVVQSVLPISPYSKSVSDPPPPPPPPVMPAVNGTSERELVDPPATNKVASDGSKTAIDKKPEDSVIDVRSDLLKAIREGIQLKKVGRQQEQEREIDVVNYGHDVAAILKRRMEDVMGRSESDSSVSDSEIDWDD